MKKLIAFALSLLMVVGLSTGTMAASDPKSVYQAAMEKTAQLPSTDMSMKMDGTISVAGQSMDYSATVGAKVVQKSQYDFDMAMNMQMNIMGVSVIYNTYYTDGYYYMDLLGQKMKMEMNLKEAMEQIASMGGGFLDGTEYLSDFSMDGNKITYTMKADALNQVLDRVLGEELNYLDLAEEDIGVQMSDFKGTAVIDSNGYLAEESVSGAIETQTMGETVSMTMNMQVIYNNPGQPVSITMPDLSDYVEMEIPGLDTSSEYDDMFYTDEVIII